MGSSRWNPSDWTAYSSSIADRPSAAIFTSSSLDGDLNPKGIVRESRDSDPNPNSTAIIVACDVTGSMGVLADTLIRKGLGVLFEEILNRKPVTDPHLMAMGIGDVDYDSAPLQVSQFEADLTIATWLEKIYIEHGGGGNLHESYDLPLYFAANKTSIDCFEKRGKKGYLFTLGDEDPPKVLTRQAIEKVIGDTPQADMPFEDVIAAAEKMYNIYHLIVAKGSHCRSYGVDTVKEKWKKYLGQRVVVLTDVDKVSEVIVSIIEVNEGRSKEDVVNSWSGSTAMVVSTAITDLSPADAFDAASSVVRL